MSKSLVVRVCAVCVVAVLPGILSAGTAAAATGFPGTVQARAAAAGSSVLADGDVNTTGGGNGSGLACVASARPATSIPAIAPNSSPSRASSVPPESTPATSPTPAVPHPSSPTALAAVPVGRVEPAAISPDAPTPTPAGTSPSPTFSPPVPKESRGLLPLMARHLRHHLPLLLVLLLVAVLPAVLAIARRNGSAASR